MTAPTSLSPGTAFPSIVAKDLDGNDVDMAASVAGSWAVVQFYRGDW